jgi:hypothetical protein
MNYLPPELVPALGKILMSVGFLSFSGCALWGFFIDKSFTEGITFILFAVPCIIAFILFHRAGKRTRKPKKLT